jgi:chemotaxis protein methyltransferase CheR
MTAPMTLSLEEFELFQALIHSLIGINLPLAKKTLVQSRLARRLREYGFRRFRDYYDYVVDAQSTVERQTMIDLITTNETRFFREPPAFQYLARSVLADFRGSEFRLWCAAASSGEEAYSLAMVMSDRLGNAAAEEHLAAYDESERTAISGDAGGTPRRNGATRRWTILASDVSQRVLDRARGGIYPIEQTRQIPAYYLKRYCLRGKNTMQGQFMIDTEIKNRIDFRQINLHHPGQIEPKSFDAVFLRNVMIYFQGDSRQQILERVIGTIKPGGYLFLGMSESLRDSSLTRVHSSVFRKP